jgi:1,4-alpha-glucan branching enzyme
MMGYLFLIKVLRATIVGFINDCFVIKIYNINLKKMIQKTYYKTKDYCKVKFSIESETAETVAVIGLNNDWKTLLIMPKKKDGSFTVEVNLPKHSTHEFKYLVNQQEWINDTSADSFEPNIYGETNSVITL